MLNVDALAAEIRRVDGNNSLDAGALAEALVPFLMNFKNATIEKAANQLEGQYWPSALGVYGVAKAGAAKIRKLKENVNV